MVIVITAYTEYALEGYELDVMDYLIKPVDFPRLWKACCKARDFHQLKMQAPSAAPEPYFFVKCNGKHEKIAWQELLFVEAADNYILIHLSGRKLMIYQTLKSMENLLPATDFMKVHKSYIIALDKVTRLEGQVLIIEKFRIPISRNYKDLVRERLLHRSVRIPPATL
jgi:DNA-binding LytR/AlgR family response regulator